MNAVPNTLALFGTMGYGEILLLALVALLIFGGRRLPDVLKNLGQGIVEFKKALSGVETDVDRAGTTQPRQFPRQDSAVVSTPPDRTNTPTDSSKSA